MENMLKYPIVILILLVSFQVFAHTPKKKQDLLQTLWPRVSDLAVQGDMVAVTTNAGLRLFQCDTKACRETDRFKTPDALAAVGFLNSQTLLIGGGQGLWGLSINKGKLKLLWHLNTPGTIRGFAFGSGVIAAAMGSMGVEVYGLAGGKPVPRNLYPTTDYCRGVAVSGHTLYAACGYQGLVALDITNPGHPVKTGLLKTEDQVRSILIKDKIAYVALGRAGVGVVDLNGLVLKDAKKVADGGRFVAVYRSFVYVADGMHGVGIFSIQGGHLKYMKHIKFRGAPVRLYIRNSRLYVANDYAGFAVLDLKDPTHPKVMYKYK